MKRERTDKFAFMTKKMRRFYKQSLRKRGVKNYIVSGNMFFIVKDKKHLLGMQFCSNYSEFDFIKAKAISNYCSFSFALISNNKKIPEGFVLKLKKCGIGLSIFDVKTNEFTEVHLADLNPNVNERVKNKKLSKILNENS
jgi:hypothetical protein